MSAYRDLMPGLAAGIMTPRQTCYNCKHGLLCEGTRTSEGLPWVRCDDPTGRAFIKVSGGIRSGSNTIKARGMAIDPHSRRHGENCAAFTWEDEIAKGAV